MLNRTPETPYFVADAQLSNSSEIKIFCRGQAAKAIIPSDTMRGRGLTMKSIADYVTDIPDFPKKGIIFRDVTTIIKDPDGFKLALDGIAEMLNDLDFDLVAGSESRGFIFGAPIAYRFNKGFIAVRKKGKLPRECISEEYALEYGTATLEMHKDSIRPGQKVVIIDDLIATGGTTEATAKMIEELGGKVVKICFVIELKGLHGRDKLKDYPVESLVAYEGN